MIFSFKKFTSISVLVLTMLSFYVVSNAKALGPTPESARLERVRQRVMPTLEQALTKQGLALGSPIFIRIFKQEKELELWIRQGPRFHLFKTYPICAFSGELGPKQATGDRQAPEGFYFVPPTALNPTSNYHLSFNIGYPNSYDRAHGRTGSFLMVHGNCTSIGCYAMTDTGIEEIYLLVETALQQHQPFFRVHIFPFRMTDKNLQQHANSPWHAFWKNLKEGYDVFEINKVPPNVELRDKKYIFTVPTG